MGFRWTVSRGLFSLACWPFSRNSFFFFLTSIQIWNFSFHDYLCDQFLQLSLSIFIGLIFAFIFSLACFAIFFICIAVFLSLLVLFSFLLLPVGFMDFRKLRLQLQTSGEKGRQLLFHLLWFGFKNLTTLIFFNFMLAKHTQEAFLQQSAGLKWVTIQLSLLISRNMEGIQDLSDCFLGQFKVKDSTALIYLVDLSHCFSFSLRWIKKDYK